MANTGIKIVLTLKEINDNTGIPTGNTKSNISSDPDYISPSTDLVSCPITTTLTCPVIIASYLGLTGGLASIEYEFNVLTSVLQNPNVNKVKVIISRDSIELDNFIFSLPNSTLNYFYGIFTGLPHDTSDIYVLSLEYLDASDTVLQTCSGPNVIS